MTPTNKALLAIIITPLLASFWWWGYLIDDVNKYDFFLFAEAQTKLQWYFHYTGYFLTFIALAYAVRMLGIELKNKRYVYIGNIVLFFSIFRLVEWWLFRGSIMILTLSIGITLLGLTILFNVGKIYKR